MSSALNYIDYLTSTVEALSSSGFGRLPIFVDVVFKVFQPGSFPSSLHKSLIPEPSCCSPVVLHRARYRASKKVASKRKQENFNFNIDLSCCFFFYFILTDIYFLKLFSTHAHFGLIIPLKMSTHDNNDTKTFLRTGTYTNISAFLFA